MIFTERNITIRNDSATINAPVILYRGDKNVEVRFILIESPYKYSNRDSINVFESTDASYAQLVIKTPNDREPIFGDITAVGNNNVTFVIRHDMIDEIEEVGKYDFQIRLFDADQTSMATTPEVVGGFIIKEPIAKEDSNNNITNSAIVGSAVVTNDLEIPTFVGGSYNKTAWHDGDVISKQKLNKMEDGIYETYELSKDNSSQIKDIANKGTTVEVLERVTKDEIERQIADGTIANLTIEDFSIEKNKLKTKMVFGVESTNMFDKNNIEIGKFIQYTTGECQEVDNLSYCASYFIPVTPGETITMTYCDQSAFYTKTKDFVSGLPNLGFDAGAFTTVVPDTAYFIRVTVVVDYLDIYQIAYGDSLTEYESSDNKITRDNIRPNEKLIDVDNLMFDLKDEIERQIADGTIANLTIEDFSIEKNKLKTKMVFGVESTNMFDKNNIEIGKFIQYTTGECQEVDNLSYCASYFIPVTPGETITMTYCDQSAFYTKTKDFVSGLPNLGFDAGAFTTVVPDTAYFIRVTVVVDYLDIYQIVSGSSLTEYESYDNKITRDNIRPKEKLIDVDNLMFDIDEIVKKSSNQFGKFREELNNLFKSTQIKFLGDSITAGMGASNFSIDKQYGGTNYVEDDMSINCYANLTRRYILENYNIEKLINVLDSNIKCMNSGVIYEDSTRMLNWFLRTENTLIETFAQFELDSNYFSIYPFLNTNMGVFSVYVNGLWFKSIDCYHESIVGETEFVVDGLPNGHKIIELKSTTTKNELSTGTRIDIGAIKVKKPIITKNYGVSGYNTKDILDRINTFVEDEDDIVFLQIGTNDRGYTKSESEFENYYKKLIDTILSKNKILIVMSSLPASDGNENDPVQNFKMKDVNRVIAKVADEKKLYFISNYNYIKRLLRIRGENIDTVLADGLHPNDFGYNELFNNIIENLNI